MNSYNQMPISYLKPQFDLWIKYLSTHQSANLFFLKNTGILPRLYQFRDYCRQKKIKLTTLDLKYSGATDALTLEKQLGKLRSHTLVLASDLFTQPDSAKLATVLQNHYLTSPYSILIAHECAPFELDSNATLSASCLYVHQSPFTLAQDHTIMIEYANNILKLWKVKLTPVQIEQIIAYCGNQPWLINECIRLWVEKIDAPIETIIAHPNFTFRLKTLFNSLPPKYRDSLNIKSVNNEIFAELFAFGLIDSNRNSFGNWLKEALALYHQTRLSTSPTQLIYDSIDLSSHFSPGELRLIDLFNSSTSTISRELVANTFYNSEASDYSDWALSQVITRLRHKLQRLNIPLAIIPKRGKGYEFVRN